MFTATGCLRTLRWLAACGWLALAAARADDSSSPLPVTVSVTADHTYLRCGPGDDF